ncbi:UDP-galactopyranose mutase [uncultured Bacteroides sp.]|uniref:UDP-galactopyranose mutase n=1 Tax=uncultured Bacteroides sp. TaxID=162156 RepID=UPI00262D2E6F|nr:UDP-galactopyranose mutase [uncultured Bacteroides sp.]
MLKNDFLVVGTGLFGATVACLLSRNGKQCLVIDKRSHIGGNVYTESMNGIDVHKYGAHIFHTSNKQVWDFVNSFVEFNRYTNSPVANYKGKLYNLPFNMNTFYQMWGVTTPEQAATKIEEQRKEAGITHPRNLEEQAISLIGKDIYYTLIKEYTEKQWGRKATELPAFIIRRLPVRYTFDNNYFNDKYQGIPVDGYTKLVEKLLAGIEVKLNTDYFEDKDYFDSVADRIIYTGEIDRYFDYCFGHLEYRTVRFETEVLEGVSNFQGNAVVNYTDAETPYTRIIEHKHFGFGNQSDTVISKEFSKEWKPGDEPYYPVNDERNSLLYAKYKALADAQERVVFGGRLAEYKYYDMHQVVENALYLVDSLLK